MSEAAGENAQAPVLEADCTLRIIYGDTDQMGVVYYANYLRFFEAGRNELVRVHGIPYRELEASGHYLPVTEARSRYVQPARYDDLIRVRTRLCEAGRVQLRFEYEIRREPDGALLCEGHTLHACLNRSGRPTRLPAALREAVARR